jgi:hypothetical protein
VEWLIRFVVGGMVVSTFALLGDVVRPKSFAGIFGAAPSVALATLALTVHSKSAAYAAIEARSMIAGAAAFVVYAGMCSVVLWSHPVSVKRLTLWGLLVWLGTALLSGLLALRGGA